MKVKSLRVHQAVKVGSKEYAFLKSEDFASIQLSPTTGIFKITDKKGSTTYTTTSNVPWWTAEEQEGDKINEQETSSKNSRRISQTKNKKGRLAQK